VKFLKFITVNGKARNSQQEIPIHVSITSRQNKNDENAEAAIVARKIIENNVRLNRVNAAQI